MMKGLATCTLPGPGKTAPNYAQAQRLRRTAQGQKKQQINQEGPLCGGLLRSAVFWETGTAEKKEKNMPNTANDIPTHGGVGMPPHTFCKKPQAREIEKMNLSLPQMYHQAQGVPPRDPHRQ